MAEVPYHQADLRVVVAFAAQMRDERVPEQVWVRLLADAGHHRRVHDHRPGTRVLQRRIEAVAAQGHEDDLSARLRTSTLYPALQAHVDARYGQEAIVVALAVHVQEPVTVALEQVLRTQTAEFANPHASVAEQANDELVSLRVAGVLHALYLFAGEHVLGLGLASARQDRAAVDRVALAASPVDEVADGTQVCLHRVLRDGLALTRAVEQRQIQLGNRRLVQLSGFYDALSLAPGQQDAVDGIAVVVHGAAHLALGETVVQPFRGESGDSHRRVTVIQSRAAVSSRVGATIRACSD